MEEKRRRRECDGYGEIQLHLVEKMMMGVVRQQLLALLSWLVVTRVGGQNDDRCFLEGGGSTDSFFVREDLEIDSVLGKLRVIGELLV